MGVLVLIIIIGVIIFSHEFGHFISAKKLGMRVDEFGFGFPPKLFGKKIGETLYSFNILPIGGFVKIFGENPNKDSISGLDAERSFVNKPKWMQAIVLVAGVVFNIILAWLLFIGVFVVGAPYDINNHVPEGGFVKDPQLTITEVLPNTPAQEAGLKPGNKILRLISGDDILSEPTMSSVQDFIFSHAPDPITVEFQRGDKKEAITVVPQESDLFGRQAIGIAMGDVGTLSLPSFYSAVVEGTKYTFLKTESIVNEFGDFFKKALGIEKKSPSEELVEEELQLIGPVGLADIVKDAFELGIVYLMILVAVISINLAFINLLPFPALDGGRLLFLIIEVIIKKPIKPQVANTVNSIGFFLLILLMAVVTYNDIAKLF